MSAIEVPYALDARGSDTSSIQIPAQLSAELCESENDPAQPFLECFSIDRESGAKEEVPSHFVAALCGLFINRCSRLPDRKRLVDAIVEHLIRCTEPTGLINFRCGNKVNFDLDSLCVCSRLLLECAPQTIDGNRVIRLILDNRDNSSGGFLTWLDRPTNRLDYFVNVHAYLLLTALGVVDEWLMQYLVENAEEFLANGSPYYRDIDFPLFLLSFYRDNEFLTGDDVVFNHLFALTQPESIGRSIQGVRFREHFCSSSKAFHSPILDDVINLYLSNHNLVPVPGSLPK